MIFTTGVFFLLYDGVLMKILMFGMHKGGTGKTLLSRLASEYFPKKGFRTLGIDLDNQCNYSRRFLNMDIDHDSAEGILPPIHPDYDPKDIDDSNWDGRSSIADIFFNEPVLPYKSKINNLDICPGHPTKLLDAERVRKHEEHLIYDKLKEFLHLPELQKTYDLVIIDTPPSRGPLTIAALKAATHLVIPSLMETQSIEGLYGMMQLFKIENLNREQKSQLVLIGIQPNQFRGQTKQHKEIFNGLKKSKQLSKYLMATPIGMRSIFSEVDQSGATPPSVFDAPKTNKAQVEATKLCKHIEKRIFVHG